MKSEYAQLFRFSGDRFNIAVVSSDGFNRAVEYNGRGIFLSPQTAERMAVALLGDWICRAADCTWEGRRFVQCVWEDGEINVNELSAGEARIHFTCGGNQLSRVWLLPQKPVTTDDKHKRLEQLLAEAQEMISHLTQEVARCHEKLREASKG